MQNPVLKNVETGQIIELVKSPFSIGRSLTSDYVIENKIISRTHCSLTKTDEGWTVTDSSTNGTLVNDGHYKGETSPILKHNDEISLGYQSYTYTFVTEVEKVPNNQVERLKSQDISGNPLVLNDVRSPGTPNSFDENGISDDLLNNLADNMLSTVERQANIAELQVQTSSSLENSTQNIFKSFLTFQQHACEKNFEQPTTSKSTGYQSECGPEVSEVTVNTPRYNTVTSGQPAPCNEASNQLTTERNPLADAVAIGNINNDVPEPVMSSNELSTNADEISQSQANSSMSTVIYSVPEEIPYEVPQISSDNSGTQAYKVNVEENKDTQANLNHISVSTVDSTTSKPIDRLSESIEAVVSKYLEDTTPSSTGAASTSVQDTGVVSSTLDPVSSTSTAPLELISFRLASSANANKKVKVMGLGSGVTSQFRLVDWQSLTACTASAEVMRLPQNNMQSQATGSSGPSTLGTSSTGTRSTNTRKQTVPGKRVGIILGSSSIYGGTNRNPVVLNLIPARVSGNTLVHDPEHQTTTALGTVLVSRNTRVDGTEDLPPPSGSTVLVTRNTLLQSAEGQSVTPGVITSSSDVIEGMAVPKAVATTVTTTGVTGVSAGSAGTNLNVPTSICHDLQVPGTSKATEELVTDKKQNNQNQYEEMENELMCTICANLFIKAVTLGCSHSFCQYCIQQWKKKKMECPICRNKITSSTRTLVLDNVIEKMLETSPEEDKAERKAAVEERKKTEEAETTKKTNANRGTNRRGRGSANTRGNGRNTNRNRPANNIEVLPPIINIADSPSTTDSDSDSLSDSFDEDDYDNYSTRSWAPYYGGYGSCYKCGEAGHWANGCPYR